MAKTIIPTEGQQKDSAESADKLEILAMLPVRVQAFVAEAHAVGIVVRYGEQRTKRGDPLISLNGSLALFAQLPAMAKCRIPKRAGHWWLSCGIIGTLRRVAQDDLSGVIEHLNWGRNEKELQYPQPTPENARADAEVMAEKKRDESRSYEDKVKDTTERYMREGPESFLESMPMNAMDFRRKIIDDIRWSVSYRINNDVKPSPRHGFTLGADSGDAIKLALDAVVDAILAADVHLDDARHTAIKHKLHTYIVQAGKGAPGQVQSLIRPNPGILSGEAP